MAVIDEGAFQAAPEIPTRVRGGWREFPYWLLGMVAVFGWLIFLIRTQGRYTEAYEQIRRGVKLTIEATLWSFAIALALGLIVGLGRISRNVVAKNIARFYIEFVRGVPVLVLIFTVAYAVIPPLSESLGFEGSSVEFKWRAIIALAVIYAAYLAEVFRAGIESIPPGQTEAGRSLGMSHGQTMRRIVLPQAIRNMTPAIGNDLIAMLKDTSLLSVVGVREMTRVTNSYAAQSFEYRPAYAVLTLFYLAMTLGLSLLLSLYRRWLGLDRD